MDEKSSKLREEMDLQQLIARIEKSEQQHKDLAKSVLKLRLEMNIYHGKPQYQAKHIIDHTTKNVSPINSDANNSSNSRTNANVVDESISSRLASLEHKMNNFQDIMILNKFGAKNVEELLPNVDEKKTAKEPTVSKIDSKKFDEDEPLKRKKAYPMVVPISKVESEKRIEDEMDKHKNLNSTTFQIDQNKKDENQSDGQIPIDQKSAVLDSYESEMNEQKENAPDETMSQSDRDRNNDNNKVESSSNTYPMVYPIIKPNIEDNQVKTESKEELPVVFPINNNMKPDNIESKTEDIQTVMEKKESYPLLYPIKKPKLEDNESKVEDKESYPMVYPIERPKGDGTEGVIENKEPYPLASPIENPKPENTEARMDDKEPHAILYPNNGPIIKDEETKVEQRINYPLVYPISRPEVENNETKNDLKDTFPQVYPIDKSKFEDKEPPVLETLHIDQVEKVIIDTSNMESMDTLQIEGKIKDCKDPFLKNETQSAFEKLDELLSFNKPASSTSVQFEERQFEETRFKDAPSFEEIKSILQPTEILDTRTPNLEGMHGNYNLESETREHQKSFVSNYDPIMDTNITRELDKINPFSTQKTSATEPESEAQEHCDTQATVSSTVSNVEPYANNPLISLDKTTSHNDIMGIQTKDITSTYENQTMSSEKNDLMESSKSKLFLERYKNCISEFEKTKRSVPEKLQGGYTPLWMQEHNLERFEKERQSENINHDNPPFPLPDGNSTVNFALPTILDNIGKDKEAMPALHELRDNNNFIASNSSHQWGVPDQGNNIDIDKETNDIKMKIRNKIRNIAMQANASNEATSSSIDQRPNIFTDQKSELERQFTIDRNPMTTNPNATDMNDTYVKNILDKSKELQKNAFSYFEEKNNPQNENSAASKLDNIFSINPNEQMFPRFPVPPIIESSFPVPPIVESSFPNSQMNNEVHQSRAEEGIGDRLRRISDKELSFGLKTDQQNNQIPHPPFQEPPFFLNQNKGEMNLPPRPIEPMDKAPPEFTNILRSFGSVEKQASISQVSPIGKLNEHPNIMFGQKMEGMSNYNAPHNENAGFQPNLGLPNISGPPNPFNPFENTKTSTEKEIDDIKMRVRDKIRHIAMQSALNNEPGMETNRNEGKPPGNEIPGREALPMIPPSFILQQQLQNYPLPGIPGPRREDPMFFPGPFHPNAPPIHDRFPNPFLPPPPPNQAPNSSQKEPYHNIKTADDYNNFGKYTPNSNDPNSELQRHLLDNRNAPPSIYPRPEHFLPPTILQDSPNASSIDKEIDDIKMKIRDKINNVSVQNLPPKRKLDDTEIDSEISSIKMKIRNKIHLAMVTKPDETNEESGVASMLQNHLGALGDYGGQLEKPDYGIAGRAGHNVDHNNNSTGNTQFTPDSINKDFACLGEACAHVFQSWKECLDHTKQCASGSMAGYPNGLLYIRKSRQKAALICDKQKFSNAKASSEPQPSLNPSNIDHQGYVFQNMMNRFDGKWVDKKSS